MILLGANRINANTAGLTGLPSPAPGAPVGRTGAELRAALPTATGALEDILAGGIHPERIVPVMVPMASQRATTASPGPGGGLRPTVGSVTQPGPAGAAQAARQAVSRVSVDVSSLVSRARRALGL